MRIVRTNDGNVEAKLYVYHNLDGDHFEKTFQLASFESRIIMGHGLERRGITLFGRKLIVATRWRSSLIHFSFMGQQ